MNDEYMNTTEVAQLCRAPVETVRYWRHIGDGPISFKVGRRVLYRRTDVEGWLTSLRASETSDGR